jgi:hypothetical protein
MTMLPTVGNAGRGGQFPGQSLPPNLAGRTLTFAKKNAIPALPSLAWPNLAWPSPGSWHVEDMRSRASSQKREADRGGSSFSV